MRSASAKTSWTIGLSVDASDSTMIYGTVSNGFKSGGFVGDITLATDTERTLRR